VAIRQSIVLAHSVAAGAENTVVARSSVANSHRLFEDVELSQSALDIDAVASSLPLKHFAQDDVGQAEALTIKLGVDLRRHMESSLPDAAKREFNGIRVDIESDDIALANSSVDSIRFGCTSSERNYVGRVMVSTLLRSHPQGA
jgi:hypothetical protein